MPELSLRKLRAHFLYMYNTVLSYIIPLLSVLLPILLNTSLIFETFTLLIVPLPIPLLRLFAPFVLVPLILHLILPINVLFTHNIIILLPLILQFTLPILSLLTALTIVLVPLILHLTIPIIVLLPLSILVAHFLKELA